MDGGRRGGERGRAGDSPERPEDRRAGRRRGGWRGVAVRLGVLFVLLAAGSVVLRVTGLAESWLFYFPGRAEFATPPGYEDVWFETEDGVRLHGWFIPATSRGAGAASGQGDWERVRGTVVHVHGNAGSLPDHVDLCAFLADAGLNVLLFDYRGFGRSEGGGRIERGALLRDTRAAVSYAASREDVDPDRIALYGFSLGGVLALAAAAERDDVRGVVTVGAFSSWQGVASDHGGLLGRVLIRSGLDAVDSVRAIGEGGLVAHGLLVVHGDDDAVVPSRHARVLVEAAEAAGVPSRLVPVPGADHVEAVVFSSEVRSAMVEFLVGSMGGAASPGER